jgi:hypothetical protein
MKTLQKQSMVRGLSLVWLALMLGSTGCATLIKSKSETVTLQSNPGDADVYIDGAPRGRTPLTLQLQPNKEYTVVFKKPGFADQAVVLTSSVSGKWVVLDVLGGLIPIIVDAATGSWKEFDDPLVNVNLPARRHAPRDEEDDEARAEASDEDERYEDARDGDGARDGLGRADRESRREEPARARRGASRERRSRTAERAVQASDSDR